MKVVPAAATPRVRDRIEAAPDGPLEVIHRGPDAIYLRIPATADCAAWCVGVLSGDAVAVPNGLRTTLPELPELSQPVARLRAGRVCLGDAELVIGRLVHARVPRIAASLEPSVTAAPVATATAEATDATAAKVLAGIGRGDGLTPYGDDVACGWLATRVAAGSAVPAAEVRAAAAHTTLLSATLLDCALHGEVLPQFAAWLARGTAAEEAALLAVGGSSGHGLLTGARLALGTGWPGRPDDRRHRRHPGREAA